MKKNIFLYLFIFAVLINIFTYMYFSNQKKYEDERLQILEKRSTALKDSLETVQDKVYNADYFSLAYNDNAKQYFLGQDIEMLSVKIRDGLFGQNTNPDGNPLVQYPPLNGKPFVISRMKVLNNRWIIAEFTNGTAVGEVLLKYFIEDDGSVTFETVQTLLYANTIN